LCGSVEQRANEIDVDLWKDFAALAAIVAITVETEDGDGVVLPDPNFAHTKTTVDFELVEATARPDHFDGQVGLFARRAD